MAGEQTLTGSLEDYLEAIYHLIRRENQARSTQLAEALKVKKSSVTVALRTLAKKQLINYAPYSNVTLTAHGETVARDIIRRHETLKEFFVTILDVDEKQADESACKMEHVLTKDMTDKFIKFMEFIDICPRNGKDWIAQYHKYYCDETNARPCVQCLDNMSRRVRLHVTGNKEQAEMSVLSKLEPGEKAEILKINHRGVFRKRILEMGVTTGAVLTVERIAPLGDPIDIKIRGYHLSLRKEEAKSIDVKILK
ncbi:metal-dependent transcriptional regulator [bacterium]|nr:metal-dependent transcriptional regulator [bacterium]